jgi:hypothetical protein
VLHKNYFDLVFLRQSSFFLHSSVVDDAVKPILLVVKMMPPIPEVKPALLIGPVGLTGGINTLFIPSSLSFVILIVGLFSD